MRGRRRGLSAPWASRWLPVAGLALLVLVRGPDCRAVQLDNPDGTTFPADEDLRTKFTSEAVKIGESDEPDANTRASELFEDAVAMDPKYSVAWRNKGVAHMRAGEYKEALGYYEMALRLSPVDADSNEFAKYVVDAHYRTEYPGAVGPKIRDLMSFWKGNAFIFTPTNVHEYSTSYGKAGVTGMAARYTLASMRKAPWMSDNHINLAVALGTFMHETRAEPLRTQVMYTAWQSFRHSIEIEPERINEQNSNLMRYYETELKGNSELTRARKKKYRRQSRLHNLHFLRSMFPDDMVIPGWHYYLEGHELLMSRCLNEAVYYFRHAIRIKKDARYYRSLAVSYALLHQYEKAFKVFKRASRLAEGGKSATKELYRQVRARKEKYEAAQEALESRDDAEEGDEALGPYLDQLGEVGRAADSEKAGERWKAALELYKETHGRMVLQEGGIESKRFVVCAVNEVIGIGNKLLVILSSFVLALVTNRALLIYWKSNNEENGDLAPIKDLFALPADLEWDYASALEIMRHISPDEIVRGSESVELFHSWNRQKALNDLLCGDLNEIYTKPFLHVNGNQYFGELIRMNPHYSDKLNAIFGADMFPIVTRYLLRPGLGVAKTIARYMKKVRYGEEGSKLITIHSRTGMKGKSVAFDTWEEGQHGAPPKLVQGGIGCTKHILNEAKEADIHVWVATDDASSREKLSSDIVDGRKKVQLHFHTASPDRATRSGLRDAIIDMWMVSLGDEFVRIGKSGFSTFAVVAGALSGRNSYLVMGCDGGSVPCVRDAHAQGRMGTKAWHFEGVKKNYGDLTCHGGMDEFLKKAEARHIFFPSCTEFSPDSMDPKQPIGSSEYSLPEGFLETFDAYSTFKYTKPAPKTCRNEGETKEFLPTCSSNEQGAKLKRKSRFVPDDDEEEEFDEFSM